VSAIRILVADDHIVVREGLRRVLDAPGFEVVGEAGSGAEAIRGAERLRPDVVMLDISMPEGNGLSTIKQIREISPSSRILMLSVYQGAEYVNQARANGAHGYLLKDTTPAELRRAIRAVHAGEAHFSDAASKSVASPLDSAAPPVAGEARTEASADAKAAVAALTTREREVLALIAAGHSNKEAAAALGISSRTVESHRDSMMKKLGVRNAAGLTRIALESGLVK
jgi:two-component system, NarL family, response regulator NreC